MVNVLQVNLFIIRILGLRCMINLMYLVLRSPHKLNPAALTLKPSFLYYSPTGKTHEI